jgi:hypothetical protein
MCKQRGWKTDSKQPERYARIVTKDVDSYYAKKFGITGGEIKEQPKPGILCMASINPQKTVQGFIHDP